MHARRTGFLLLAPCSWLLAPHSSDPSYQNVPPFAQTVLLWTAYGGYVPGRRGIGSRPKMRMFSKIFQTALGLSLLGQHDGNERGRTVNARIRRGNSPPVRAERGRTRVHRAAFYAAALAALISTCAARAGDALDIVARQIAVFDAPPRNVPTGNMPDGPLLGNGDLGAALAGPPEDQRFYIGKNDFWRRSDTSPETVGMVSLSIPDLKDASYRQEQDMANAEARGTFSKGDRTVRTRSWVDANENLLVTQLQCAGAAVDISLRQGIGEQPGAGSVVVDNIAPVNIGREQLGGGRWYFDGNIDDLRIEGRALSSDEIRARMEKAASHDQSEHFDGKSIFERLTEPAMTKAVSVSGWIRIDSASPEANFIVSKGEWNQAYSLGLSSGCLRWSVNGTFVQTKQPLELHKWLHVAGTFDGLQMLAYINGEVEAALYQSGSGKADPTRGMLWFTRDADSMPGSREVAVVSRILGGNTHLDVGGGLSVTLPPREPLTVVTAVLSDLDSKDSLAAATRRVESLQPADIDKLSVQHRAWWASFWSRSFIEIPDKEIEKRWYAATYFMGSCSRPGKVAPGIWGCWVTTDHPWWHGDYHLNYNFEAPFYGVYSGNHSDLSLPFCEAILDSMPNGRAIAKSRGWKGIHLPVSIGPWGLLPEGPGSDWGQRSDAALAALNFIWEYQYTQNTDFLRTSAYPYLRDVADFWEDYLKFENGRYVIYNDSIHEGSGPNFNPLLSLALVRALFHNLIPMSKDLGIDAERRAKWQDICDKISAFPTQEMGGKTVFRYSEKGTAWWGGNTVGVYHIFPAGAIGLDSDPKLLEISRNTIDAMNRWADDNGFSNWYTACARVGYDPKIILARLHDQCDKHSLPNLMLYYSGGGIESCGGFLAINEMLLQSCDGVIRFFPDWPKEQNARFGTLRAVGAFLVSAELRDGVIGGVKIVSEKGRDCTIVNPWPGKSVRVIRNGKSAESSSGERFTLKTAATETLELVRAGL